jgi:hypothetical protein
MITSHRRSNFFHPAAYAAWRLRPTHVLLVAAPRAMFRQE